MASVNQSDKKSFAVKNPSNGKIIGFINGSQFIDDGIWDSLSGDDLKKIISQCEIDVFVKSTDSADAFAGINLK